MRFDRTMMTKALVPLFLSCLLSCESRTPEPVTIRFDELLEHLEDISFEERDSSLMDNPTVGGICFLMDNIVVLDWNGGRILMFDSSGRFIRQVGRRGEGPGEYKIPKRGLTTHSNLLYIDDNLNNRVLIFDSCGTFISELPLHGFVNSVWGVCGDSIVSIGVDHMNGKSRQARLIVGTEMSQLFSVDKYYTFPGILSRVISQHSIPACSGCQFFLLDNLSFNIWKLSLDGSVAGSMETPPRGFRAPSRDEDNLEEILHQIKQYTPMFSFLKVGDKLVASWAIREDRFLEVYDENLRHLVTRVEVPRDLSYQSYSDGKSIYFFRMFEPAVKSMNHTLVKFALKAIPEPI